MTIPATVLWMTPPTGTLTDAMKWQIVKDYRQALLSQSAWTQLPDAILTQAERAAWIAYRETLQGLEFAYPAPDSVIIPDAPAIAITAPAAAQIAARDKRKAAINEAALATAFRTLTAAQAETYIDNNVTTLATAKAALRIFARLLVALRDANWPDL
jgi:hypothetical protein